MSTQKPSRPGAKSSDGNRQAGAGATPASRRLAQQRAAAALDRAAQARRRRQWVAVGGGVAAVLLVIGVLVVVKLVTGAGGPSSGQAASTLPATELAQIAGVPPTTLNSIGAGTAQHPPVPIKAPALTDAGKPELLYIGAGYCPYCAAERWAIAVALSRFGTLHDVGQSTSSPDDVYPSTATLSFHGASYDSALVTFVPKEIESNQVVNGRYAPLDTLTAQQQALESKYNAPPYVSSAGSIPFVDIGGKYLISGASYDPGVLKGKTHAQIAAALASPSSPIAQAIDGTANLVSAALCATTGGKPAAVCSSAGVRAAAGVLTKK